MLRLIDQATAVVLLLVGCAHVAVGRLAFTDPTEARVWFMSAGLLGMVAGLANLARARASSPSRLAALSAVTGSVSMVTMGGLLLRGGGAADAPTLVVLAVSVVSVLFGLRDVVGRNRR